MTSTEDGRPGPAVTPELGYRDPRSAIRWLCDVLGIRQGLIVERPDGGIAHAELWWQDSAIFLGSRDVAERDRDGSSVCLVANNAAEVDGIWEQAQNAQADIAFPLSDTPFGSHQCAVRDPEGYTWTVGTYRPQAPPEDQL
jgi:uncharacterized glyoxalase superfamily protein PhnB